MSTMRVAVIGGGISGLASAYVLANAGVDVVVYEKEDYLGGSQAKTVSIDGIYLDISFMLLNPAVTYSNMMEFLESLGVDLEASDMSFSISLEKGQGCEWGNRKGFSSLIAQKKNMFNPYYWQMHREIIKFKEDVLRHLEELEKNPDVACNETLGKFINSSDYSDLFMKGYLVPLCSSIWSSPTKEVMDFSAHFVLSFFHNNHLLEVFGHPQWIRIRQLLRNYVNKVKVELENRGCQIRCGCEINSVSTVDSGCVIIDENGSQEAYGGCIMAVDVPNALKILGKGASYDELRILGAFQYVKRDVYLHHDKNLMPQNPAAWSAWNFLQIIDSQACVTLWLNLFQSTGVTEPPFLVTLDPPYAPKDTVLKWSTCSVVPSLAASKALLEVEHIQGKRGIWFCVTNQGYGFHEDRLKIGLTAAHGILRQSSPILKAKHVVPSLMERAARFLVTRFFRDFITAGSLILLEEGGTIFTFKGATEKCPLKVSLRVHSPQFYVKIASEADLGLADAYINGDFSFVDENKGLLNLFMILIASKDLKSSHSSLVNRRGWWTPVLSTAGIASAKYFLRHILNQNTLTQSRRNISRHYDMSNEVFALFLDETMTYSCAVFKSEGEDLKVAQLRKISALIEKARIQKHHEILDIGCGWGGLAIEVVKKTGCKYTGITLSEEQLKFAEAKVKEAGLQDHITFLLCDYRHLPDTHKYDRIISCGMIEHVGHEYMDEFFSCCDSALAEDGILVLQFISIQDHEYDENRRTPGFIKEYIFPGGCIPSLSRVISAMAAASKLCVEHLENIGMHYYQTLRCWRKNFLENQIKIMELGFDEKFIRTWEYYFDYSAAGFKSRFLGDYQIVFSRHSNVAEFCNPYKHVPSAFD